MKKYIIMKALAAVAVLGAVLSCTYDPYKDDLLLPAEKLTLSAVSGDIALDADNLGKDILTFNWTPARELSDEYVISYTTKLDVVGNNFGTTTAIRHEEENGVYTRSFTSEQLNNWANERWGLPVNKPFTLEFRVVVDFSGGPEFQAPEVRTITVNVTPIHVDIFAADKMLISGSAIADEQDVKVTAENPNLFAWYGDLRKGLLTLPTTYEGMNYYIHPVSGTAAIQPGVPVDLVMDETEAGWNIAAAGKHRVVVNMETKQAIIYDEANDLQPLMLDFYPNGSTANALAHVTVTDLYAYGAGTGWGVRKLNCTQSAADPQVFIYQGSFNGGVKFPVAQNFTAEDGTSYNQNNAYCFTNVLTAEGKRQNLVLSANKLSELWGGADGETRNSYYGMPAGNHLFIFDLRNRTIIAKPVQ